MLRLLKTNETGETLFAKGLSFFIKPDGGQAPWRLQLQPLGNLTNRRARSYNKKEFYCGFAFYIRKKD